MNEWRRIWVATPLFHPNAFRPLKIAMCRPKNATEVANTLEVKIQSSKAPFIKFDDVSGVQKSFLTSNLWQTLQTSNLSIG